MERNKVDTVALERVTVSTLVLYTCRDFVIRGAPREQPLPLSLHFCTAAAARGRHEVNGRIMDGIALAEPLESQTAGVKK